MIVAEKSGRIAKNLVRSDCSADAKKDSVGITHYQMYKIANDKNITTYVIGVICAALVVETNDIMDFIPDE